MCSESISQSNPRQPSLKPTPAQVVARMLLRRDVRVVGRAIADGVAVRDQVITWFNSRQQAEDRVEQLRAVFEPLLIEAFEAGRLSVLGDLSEPVFEHGFCSKCGGACDSTCPECRKEG